MRWDLDSITRNSQNKQQLRLTFNRLIGYVCLANCFILDTYRFISASLFIYFLLVFFELRFMLRIHITHAKCNLIAGVSLFDFT